MKHSKKELDALLKDIRQQDFEQDLCDQFNIDILSRLIELRSVLNEQISKLEVKYKKVW